MLSLSYLAAGQAQGMDKKTQSDKCVYFYLIYEYQGDDMLNLLKKKQEMFTLTTPAIYNIYK